MSSLTSQRSAWLDPRPIGDRQLSLMDHLFNRLDGMYPNRWRAAFTSEDAVQNWRESWAEAFVEEGITPHQVADGIRACRRQFDWPPSLTEFLKACKPHIDPETAFAEACEQMRARDTGTDKWSSPAVYWAAVEFGSWELRHASWDRAKSRWTRILTEKLAQADLPEVPPRREALPAPGQTRANPEKVREMLDALRQRMAMPKGAA